MVDPKGPRQLLDQIVQGSSLHVLPIDPWSDQHLWVYDCLKLFQRERAWLFRHVRFLQEREGSPIRCGQASQDCLARRAAETWVVEMKRSFLLGRLADPLETTCCASGLGAPHAFAD